MDLSFHDERPRSDTVAARRYIGGGRSTWRGTASAFGQRLQADRAPGTGEWLVSHLELFAAAPLTAGLHVNGRYVLLRPESFPDAPGLPAERRERASAGLLLVGRAGSASVDGGVVRTQAGGNRPKSSSRTFPMNAARPPSPASPTAVLAADPPEASTAAPIASRTETWPGRRR